MAQRVIPCKVIDDYITGDGVTIGGAGSHNDVLLELDFRAEDNSWRGTTRTVTFTNALGLDPVDVLLTVNLLAPGQTEVYLVPVPVRCKAYPGWISVTIRGVEIDGENEILRIVTGDARFRVLDNVLHRWEGSEDVPATVAEQVQAQVDAYYRQLYAEKVNRPREPYDKDGTKGQVLETLGNGATKWSEPVRPTVAQVEEALALHPEWTTTVQDGALEVRKLTDEARGLTMDGAGEQELVASGGQGEWTYVSFSSSCIFHGRELYINRYGYEHQSDAASGVGAVLGILERSEEGFVTPPAFLTHDLLYADVRDPHINVFDDYPDVMLVTCTRRVKAGNTVTNTPIFMLLDGDFQVLDILEGPAGNFLWGNTLLTSDGYLITAAYSGSRGIKILRSSAAFTGTLDGLSFAEDEDVIAEGALTEPNLAYAGGKLVCTYRISSYPSEMIMTDTLDGSEGWSQAYPLSEALYAICLPPKTDGRFLPFSATWQKGGRTPVVGHIDLQRKRLAHFAPVSETACPGRGGYTTLTELGAGLFGVMWFQEQTEDISLTDLYYREVSSWGRASIWQPLDGDLPDLLISAGDDLDDYTSIGSARTVSRTVAAQVAHSPTDRAFRLDVMALNGAKTRLQVVRDYYNTFQRVGVLENGVWTFDAWFQTDQHGLLTLAANDDLDGLTVPVTAVVKTTEIAETIRNSPVKRPFRLEVRYSSNTSVLIQTMESMTQTAQVERYARRALLASGAWNFGAWTAEGNTLGVPLKVNDDLTAFSVIAGNWRCESSAIARSLADCPVEEPFSMTVRFVQSYMILVNELTTISGVVMKRFVSRSGGVISPGPWKTAPAAAWVGKSAAVYGDSIAKGNLQEADGGRVDQNFIQIAAAKLDMTVTNHSLGGAALTTGTDAAYSIWEDEMDSGSPTADEADLILVSAGTNDWGHDAPLGQLGDTGTTTFYGAVAKTLDALRTANPDAVILAVLPLYRGSGTGLSVASAANGAGVSMVEYREAMLDVCKTLGVPVLDMSAKSGVHPVYTPALFGSDHLHPLQGGHDRMGAALAKTLECLGEV